MSSVLYYSNYCEKCKHLLEIISKSNSKNDIHFICIDKRFKNNENGGTYVILENQQKILLPPQIQKVPAMLLLKEGNKVIFGNQINEKIQPVVDFEKHKATNFNGEPMAFTIGNDNVGCFGVTSDNFSYWDQDSNDLLAKGDGGLRQMYNYASINFSDKIETPTDSWSPDKVDENEIKKMEAERNQDLQPRNEKNRSI
tara:strand:- start:2187 stop:2780 length:594 start_codon:yes stop_codon:yes gene_type:complete